MNSKAILILLALLMVGCGMFMLGRGCSPEPERVLVHVKTTGDTVFINQAVVWEDSFSAHMVIGSVSVGGMTWLWQSYADTVLVDGEIVYPEVKP